MKTNALKIAAMRVQARAASAKQQSGSLLIEALIAILVLTFGMMGLTGLQARVLVESRTTNARATALRLISDLNERISMNYIAGASYVDANGTGTAPAACETQAGCTPVERASYDMIQWKQSVTSVLAGGGSTVTLLPDGRQLLVVLSWDFNEKGGGTTTPAGFQITGVNVPAECGSTKICHAQYLELPYVTPGS